MSESASDNSGAVSFPTFHERVGELTPADLARVRLAAATRALVHDAFMSTSSADDIEAAVAAIESAITHVNTPGGINGSAAAESHFSDRSPFYGAMNPISMPMQMGRDDSIGEFGCITGTVRFTEPYEGPPGHCHGGFIAGAFDEVLGMAQSLTGRPGMTGNLSVNYRAPTPLHTDIVYRGWVDRVDGRKIFTKGTAHNGDVLCAEAEAIFISMPVELMDRLRKGRDVSGQPQG
jgi:acyl-coenzyme A thioesterase PaaI-like protein